MLFFESLGGARMPHRGSLRMRYATLFLAALILNVASPAAPAPKPTPWENDLTPIAAADWNYDRAAPLVGTRRIRRDAGGDRAARCDDAAASGATAVRYQSVENPNLPVFHPSIFFRPTTLFRRSRAVTGDWPRRRSPAKRWELPCSPSAGTMWLAADRRLRLLPALLEQRRDRPCRDVTSATACW